MYHDNKRLFDRIVKQAQDEQKKEDSRNDAKEQYMKKEKRGLNAKF